MAQVDWFQAKAVIAGEPQGISAFAMRLRAHSHDECAEVGRVAWGHGTPLYPLYPHERPERCCCSCLGSLSA